MDVKDFDYELPLELIAQTPLEKRSDSRLEVVNRFTGEIEHKHFYDILDYLTSNDVLVLNDTKVMPSRIYGEKVDTNAKIEFLLLRETTKDVYESLVKPARRIKPGTLIKFSDSLSGEIVSKEDEGICPEVRGRDVRQDGGHRPVRVGSFRRKQTEGGSFPLDRQGFRHPCAGQPDPWYRHQGKTGYLSADGPYA